MSALVFPVFAQLGVVLAKCTDDLGDRPPECRSAAEVESVADAVSRTRLPTVSDRCRSIDPKYPNLYPGADLAIDVAAHFNERSIKRNVAHDAGNAHFFTLVEHASSGPDIPFDRQRSWGVVAGEKAAEITASGRCGPIAYTTCCNLTVGIDHYFLIF